MKSKTYFVATRLNEEQYRKLEFLCKKTGFSQYKVLRNLLNEAELKERPSPDYRDLCRRMDRIGNNINQIARRVNTVRGATGKDVAELVSEFTDLKTEVKAWKNRWL